MDTNNVTMVIDRPLGSTHPTYPELIYPINYGYIPGTMAADGEPEDAYLLGVSYPVCSFTGHIIARIHRHDDIEDKWVIAPRDMTFTEQEIRNAVHFQERFFFSTIQLL